MKFHSSLSALFAASLLAASALTAAEPAMAGPKGGMMEPAKSDSKPMMHEGMAKMTPGLQVGDKAPAFTLKDAMGKEVSLSSLLAKGKVTLVFYRSADWCPFCQAQLKDIQANLAKLEATGTQLVAISYDSPEVLTRAAEKFGLTFPLLSDVGSKTIDAYGIRNQEATGRGMGIPHPVVFILDQQGVIRAKLMEDNYRTRPQIDAIVGAINGVM